MQTSYGILGGFTKRSSIIILGQQQCNPVRKMVLGGIVDLGPVHAMYNVSTVLAAGTHFNRIFN